MANDREKNSATGHVEEVDCETEQQQNGKTINSSPTAATGPGSGPPVSLDNGQQRKEENIFSFRHFLKNSADGKSCNSKSSITLTTTNAHSSAPGGNSSIGSSLGARPKVPQYSLYNGGSGCGADQMQRMKRSPKFPSFDSHASLSEYSDEISPPLVQRSHSNYEVETPAKCPISNRKSDNNNISDSSTNNGGSRANTEFSAGLPDFVKDHLVFEEWYQNNPFRIDDDAVAQPGSSSRNQNASTVQSHHPVPLQLAFDEHPASSTSPASCRRQPQQRFDLMSPFRRHNSPANPLDLPPYDENNSNRMQMPLDLPHPRYDLPFDLTDRHASNSRNEARHRTNDDARSSSPPPQVQADMIQTLPDFLSDGPIHSSGRLADVAQDLPTLDSPEENTNNIISRLKLENDRLRHELDEARRIMSDQQRQLTERERECRSSEIQRNGIVLEKSKMQQRINQLTVRSRLSLWKTVP